MILAVRLPAVAAINIDAMHVLFGATGAILLPGGYFCLTTKVVQVGREVFDKTAEVIGGVIHASTDSAESIVEDSIWGLAMVIRAVLVMLAVAVVSAAGSLTLSPTVRQRLGGPAFSVCCTLVDAS